MLNLKLKELNNEPQKESNLLETKSDSNSSKQFN